MIPRLRPMRLYLPAAAILLTSYLSAAPVINEVQSTNTSLPDQYGQLLDWVEIHNPTDSVVDLSGYHLSDSGSNRTKFTFPSGTTLGAGQFLIVWCGQTSEFPATGPYPANQLRATNFAISAGGEPIVLAGPGGSTLIDEYPALPIGTSGSPAVGRSLGRGTGPNAGVLYFYNIPTRGAGNITAGSEAVPLDPPTVSLDGGIYATGQTVSLSTTVTGGTIRYSLDGSEPTESSPVYSAPLPLGTGGNNATSYSWIPTNPGGDAGFPLYDNWQAPQGPVARIHVLRARVFKSGGAASRPVTKSYIIDPAGTDRYAFPVVSIASDPANLFSDRTGIYVHGNNTYSTDWPNTPGAVPAGLWANYFQTGSDWERTSHLEFFERDGTRLLEGTIGLRINGNTTRGRPRKALRIYNRNPAGPTTWTDTALFPDRETRSWSTFLLRAAGNDWNQSLFRDALVSAIAAPTGIDRQAARPVVLFLNGEYWGLHNLRERIDENWIFHRYGLTEDQFTMLEVTSGGPNFLNPTSDFSWPVYDSGVPALLDDYKDILVRAGNNEFAGAGGYAALDARIDVENFIDYSALTIWSGNTDWPGNNMLLWRSATTTGSHPRLDGRWRYVLKDNDFALGLNLPYVPGHDYNVTAMAQHNTLAYATSETGTTWANNEIGTRLLRKALGNSEFRNKFINRFADLLNTTLSAAATTAELDEHIAAYQPGIAEHSARWPTPLNWTNEVERIRGYVQARPAALRGHIAGKFGLVGTAQLGVALTNTNHGVLSVNTLRLEPSTHGIGTNAANWAGTYFRGVPVTLRAEAKPGYRFVAWSNSVAPAGGGVVASDAATNYTSWTNGANRGTGFGPWSLNTSTTDSRRAGTFLDTGRGGWGLYANNEQLSWVYRSLSNALQVGQTFTARAKHGSVDWPGEVGFELANSNGGILFKFSLPWWSPTYEINGEPTEIPATTSPLDLEVTLVTSNSYSARITPVGGTTYTNSGTLFAESDRAVRRFIAYNYSAGSGGAADVFVTSMQVTAPASGAATNYALFSTSATITPTLSNAANFIATFAVEPATTLSIVPPAVGAAGTPLGAVQVRAVNSIGDADGNYQGLVILTVTGPGGFSQVVQGNAVNGVAEFAGLNLPRSGSYQFNAVSGSLAAAPTVSLAANDAAVFLPTNNAVWHVGGNWDTGTVPNGTRAVVTIPANPAADRNVTNNAPTTVASINFDQGNSAFRNRINGTAGQSLTLQSAEGPSVITVTGTGVGHANIEVAGGAILSNTLVLDVRNTGATNAEYGALRLQGIWSGEGDIIKRGAGMAGITGAGKTFAGQVVVEQGVLTFSEPALTGNSMTNYTVQPGGQLRLSSAGNPRNYLFKGPLNLAGSGRSGVPDNENLGVLGALRLETGSTGTTALLTNNLHLTASADIHVPSGNAIRLDGPLTTSTNTNVLAKSGGGTLVLSGHASAFTGGLAVSRGVLRFDAAMLTNTVRALVLTNETVLTGTGRWGGSLVARDGSALAFFPGLSPGDVAPLQAGSFAAIGTVTIAVTPGEGAVTGAYPLLAVDGTAAGLDNLSLALASTNFPAGSLSFSNGTLYAVLSATVNPATAWLAQYGLPTDGSGNGAADADPDGDGLVNLFERALFSNPLVAESRGWPVTIGSEVETFVVTYRVARDQNDLTVSAESSPVLGTDAVWTALASEISDDTHADYVIYRAVLPQAGTSGFVRIKVTVRAGE